MNLHPDLLPYYHDDGWVHHPLLIGSYSPDWYKFANESYLTKRDIAREGATRPQLVAVRVHL